MSIKSNSDEKHQPLVSVLVPVYKTEQFLEECLDSLINQTLIDIEIICVNDGSPDNCKSILKRYAEKDSRIVVVNKENGGLPSARNAGLDIAKGKYVGFVDSDDYVQPNMFERLLQTAEKYNCEIVICGANIYPLNPAPDEWLKQTLSPQNKVYKNFTPELIFDEPSSRPFIWRTFIKRDLIERNNMRLQEDISVGEDNAFQFRLYPLAKGVALISDKLYNYRWYREGSMMNSGIYANKTKRVESHVKLVAHIADKWLESGIMEKMSYEFLKWSINFLYDDFIGIPLNDRIRLAKMILSTAEKCSYSTNKSLLPVYVNDIFDFFCDCAKEKETSPKVSVIIPIFAKQKLPIKNIQKILKQSLHEAEFIIINNGTDDDTYAALTKCCFADKRIRIFNQRGRSFAEVLNQGLFFVQAPYVVFMFPNNDYADSNILQIIYDKAVSENFDICLCQHDSNQNKFDNFQHSLYKTSFLKQLDLKFKDFSICTGEFFLAEACANTERKGFADKELCIDTLLFDKSEFSLDECINLLNGIEYMLKLSIQNQNAELHTQITTLLNNDKIISLIIEASCNISEKNKSSLSKIWERLMKICSLISPTLVIRSENNANQTALPKVVYHFVEAQHNILSEMSGKYKEL